jgi:hypothetical protein
LNGIKSKNPIKFIKDVTTQQDVEEVRVFLHNKHGLESKNNKIDKHNADPFSGNKLNRYEILFSIRQFDKENFLQS